MKINSKSHQYTVYAKRVLDLDLSQSHVISDAIFCHRDFLRDVRSVSLLHVNEREKNLDTVETVLHSLNQNKVKKSDELVVIGGGFVQDIATIACSLYMRGISWIYVPTTLAAMGDSCLGGKSSINLGVTKNLIGSFYPPRQIIIDVGFLKSISSDDYLCGISEMVKIAIAQDSSQMLKMVASINLNRVTDLSDEAWISIITQSLSIKKRFIESDEFDDGIRKLLNFGHTFGHALESASNFRIPHGIAVAFGILVACSHPNSILDLTASRLSSFMTSLLERVSNTIGSEFQSVDWDIYERALFSDKKNSQTKFCPILWDGEKLYSANLDYLGEGGPHESTIISRRIMLKFLNTTK